MALAVPESTTPTARAALVRRVVGIALCFLTAILVVVMAFDDGGYFPASVLLLGAIAFTGCGLGFVGGGGRLYISRAGLALVVGLLGLAAFTWLSSAWSPDVGGAALQAQRTLAYAGVALLALLAAGRGRYASLLLRLVALALMVVCAVALVSRVQPDVIATDGRAAAFNGGRLGYPIGYWNGLGAVAAMLVVAGIGFAADSQERLVSRCIAASAGTLGVWTLYLTLSRASGIAVAIALAIVVGASRYRVRIAVTGLAIVGVGILGVLVLHSRPVLTDQPATLDSIRRAGDDVTVPLLGLVILSAAIQAGLARVRMLNRGRPTVYRGRSASAAAWALPFAGAALLFVGAYAALADRIEGRAANGTVEARSFLDRQYSDFLDTSRPAPAGQQRLSSARSSRSDAYRVAWDGFKANPFVGDGAAGYRVRWMREREVPEAFRNAHSLELETLSDLGIVGGALLLSVLLSMGVGLRALRRGRGGLSRSQAVAPAGIVVVFFVHSALDWDWQLAAVTIPAFAAAAALLSGARQRRSAGTAS